MTDERRPNTRHRIEHALYSGAVMLSSALGVRGSSAFGGAVGKLGYFPIKFRTKLVEKNLRLAFPDRDDEWIRKTMRAAYAHLGREALETLRLSRVTREELIARADVTGFDEFKKAFAEGKGVVLVTGHVGNHEMAASLLAAYGFPLDVVVQQQENPLFNAALNDARARLGVRIIDRFQAHRLAIKSLRTGRTVGFAADQNAGKAGVFVPFFGKLASTHRGPALFALKTGAPMFLATLLRRGDRYEGTLQRVEVDRSGPLENSVYNLTAAFTAKLEEVVRAAPEQYLWLHRRWKTAPPEPFSGEPTVDKQV
jgi:Kdo2-lipid IVA lauroyltransferase/acyltransferase